MKQLITTLVFFIFRLGIWIGIILGLFSFFWILYAEWFATPENALNGASTPIGHLWFFYHTHSLNFSQAIIQRYFSVSLWDNIILPALVQPIWLFCLLTLGGNLLGLVVVTFLRAKIKVHSP